MKAIISVISSLLILLFLILHGPGILGLAWENVGLITLLHTLTSGSFELPSELTERTMLLLHRAVMYAPENHRGWWWLGFTLAAQEREEEAMRAWHKVGAITEEFMRRGESCQQAKQYLTALQWYERATRVAPELGKPWYEIGKIYEQMGQWEIALQAYEHATVASVFTGIGRSSPYYREGLIYQWRLEPRQLEDALAAYEAAIEIDAFSDDLTAASCHFQRGEILRWTGRNPDEYLAEYQRAIALDPDYAFAYVYLGVAYYTRDGDAEKAIAEIQKALTLAPNNQWAYYHLGEIYRQEGRVTEAMAMYERAVELDPDFEIASERLKSLPDVKR